MKREREEERHRERANQYSINLNIPERGGYRSNNIF